MATSLTPALPRSRRRLRNVTSCAVTQSEAPRTTAKHPVTTGPRGLAGQPDPSPALEPARSPYSPGVDMEEWLHTGGSPVNTGRTGLTCTLAWWHMGRGGPLQVPCLLLHMGRMQPANSSWKGRWRRMGRSSRNLTGQAKFPATRMSHLLSYCLPFPDLSRELPSTLQTGTVSEEWRRLKKKKGKKEAKTTMPKTNIAKDRTHQILKESNSSCQQGGHRNCSQMWQGCHLL